jgi:hypothetical protein
LSRIASVHAGKPDLLVHWALQLDRGVAELAGSEMYLFWSSEIPDAWAQHPCDEEMSKHLLFDP